MKELTVVYQGFGQAVPIGTLADNGKGVLFEYSQQALAQRLELSPLRLPLRLPAYPDRQGDYRSLHDVPGLIYDSEAESFLSSGRGTVVPAVVQGQRGKIQAV